MEQLVKGSVSPRETVKCTKCGSSFDRAVVHPYIITCPTCRGKQKDGTVAEKIVRKKVRCPDCRTMINQDGGLGMHLCKRCRNQWWSMPGRVWRDWVTDEMFASGIYVGSLREASFHDLWDKIKVEA